MISIILDIKLPDIGWCETAHAVRGMQALKVGV
jgi:hypothetical protein